MKKIIIIFAVLLSFGSSFAEDAAPQQEKPKGMTRAEVIDRLSATDFFKKKIGDLFNWSVGYDITKINRTNLAPTISFIKATPVKVPPDNRTVVLITAKVSDPSGPDNIRGVRADLSEIKKLPNTMLVDNGLWGDTNANDGVYTLQTSVPMDVERGGKEIPVAVSNKMGWVALGKTDIDVETNPIILETKAVPPAVPADDTTQVKLAAKVINPGRQEDLKDVLVDLRPIGLEDNFRMWDDATHGDSVAGDRYYTVVVTVKNGTVPGVKKLQVRAINISGGTGVGEITLAVQ